MAETRIALVIGESAYVHVRHLPNPAADAELVGAALRNAGFQTVMVRTDLDQAAFRQALREFASQAANADVALIYYAGHGMEMGGVNYLIPKDAVLANDWSVSLEAIPLDTVMQVVRARRLGMVVLDACRDNPFAATMAISAGVKRDVERGLKRVEPHGNTLVVYAARDGATADDGDDGHSPFSRAFAARVGAKGVEVGLMLRQVRDDVLRATHNGQEPFTYGSLSGEPFYFVPVSLPQPAAPDVPMLETIFWTDSHCSEGDPVGCRAYLKRYPQGAFAELAQARLQAQAQPRPPAGEAAAPRPSPLADAGEGDVDALPSGAFKIDLAVQAQSMKDVPAIVQAAGLNCTLTDAYLLGTSEEKVRGKSVKSNVYELACGPGDLGYLVVAKPGADPVLFNCLSLKNAADKAIANKQEPGNTCVLPENKDPKVGLLPLLTQGGVADCGSVVKGQWMGASKADKLDVFEASCASGGGYLILTPEPGSAKMLQIVDCAKSATVGVTCELTTPERIFQRIIKLAAPKPQPGCTPAKARWVVTDMSNNSDFWEVGCTDATSYMFQTDSNGGFKQVIPCVRATRIAGGCTFSNVDAGQTADIGAYQKLITQAGYPCKLSKYLSYGAEADGPREVVEVACADHPEGGFTLAPTGAGQTGAYYNCVRATVLGLTCRLSSMSATYAKISSEIAARGKVICNVDGARGIGKDDKGQDYVEVTCGAAPSLVLTYSGLPQETLISAVPCAQAPVANACILNQAPSRNSRPQRTYSPLKGRRRGLRLLATAI